MYILCKCDPTICNIVFFNLTGAAIGFAYYHIPKVWSWNSTTNKKWDPSSRL